MGFKKTEIEILLFLIDEIEKHFSKNKIFTQDGIVKGINEEITFKENRVPPATLKRFLNFKKKPNNISKDVIHKVAKWYTGGNFVSLEAFKNRNSKDFDDYIKSNEDFFNDFFKKFQKLKIKDVNENHEDEFDFKLEEVTKLNKEEALLDNLKKQGFEKKSQKEG